MENSNSARVTWLEAAWILLREKFLPDAPETAAVTIGFPSKSPKKAVGQCWGGWKDGEGFFVSVSPLAFPDPVRILETLLHEMVHAAIGLKEKHNRKFARKCADLGFHGPATANWAGPDLKPKLQEVADQLGQLPPGKGELEIKPPTERQSTRMRKYVCPCGQIIRAAKDGLKVQHLDCGKEFEQEDKPTGDENGPTKSDG